MTDGASQGAMKAALQAYVDGINRGDAQAVIALFADDAVIEDPVGTPPKRGREIIDWFHQAVAMGAHLVPIGPPRGSHGNAAALAFIVTTDWEGERTSIHSLDTCLFDGMGKIVELKG
ncbi:nuclear transport factor 2 family protein [Sphingomonas sp. KC8]|uniref:nuclear transport factor 2 family protein n=1 Tax=Sphingomonas sp. KC8 TaxID=1030157 RepID=UPI00024885CD|nr:nuclear transport factor 2 family protein [Sphingomonas sp. KC8]ARS25808.1 steroid delta-isomerase [Sphingomonas sp. KC8]